MADGNRTNRAENLQQVLQALHEDACNSGDFVTALELEAMMLGREE
jgi:hypothetical protein